MPEITVLGLDVPNFMGPNEDEIKLKLRTIEAGNTSTSDEALKVIGKRCPDLAKLGVEGCNVVTEQGIKLLVSMCTKLQTIHLNISEPVSVASLDLLVKSSPSLKEIIVPYQFVPTEEQRKLFLHNDGFLVRAEDVYGWTWRYKGF